MFIDMSCKGSFSEFWSLESLISDLDWEVYPTSGHASSQLTMGTGINQVLSGQGQNETPRKCFLTVERAGETAVLNFPQSEVIQIRLLQHFFNS